MTLKCKLKEILSDRNLDQRKLARAAGVSDSTITNMVNNKIPRLDNAQFVAKALMLTTDDIWEFN